MEKQFIMKERSEMTLTLLCFELLPDPTRVSVSISWFLSKSKNGSICVSETSSNPKEGEYHTGSKCLLVAIPSPSLSLPPLASLSSSSLWLSHRPFLPAFCGFSHIPASRFPTSLSFQLSPAFLCVNVLLISDHLSPHHLPTLLPCLSFSVVMWMSSLLL